MLTLLLLRHYNTAKKVLMMIPALARQHGVSLLEQLVVIALIAILAVIGLPQLNSQSDTRALRQAGERVSKLIEHARQLAMAHQREVFVVFRAGEHWCVGIALAPDCDCGSHCHDDYLPLTVTDEKQRTSLLHTNFVGQNHLRFDGQHGMNIGHAGHFLFASAQHKLRVILSNLGRVRMCTESHQMWGMRQCA